MYDIQGVNILYDLVTTGKCSGAGKCCGAYEMWLVFSLNNDTLCQTFER